MQKQVGHPDLNPCRFHSISGANQATIKSWIDKIPGNPYGLKLVQPTPTIGNTTKIKEVLQSVVSSTKDDVVVWLLTDNLVDKKAYGTSADEALTRSFTTI